MCNITTLVMHISNVEAGQFVTCILLDEQTFGSVALNSIIVRLNQTVHNQSQRVKKNFHLPCHTYIFLREINLTIDTSCSKLQPCYTCRIKTGHSNLVSCFGPRMRALAKVFYRGESRGKIPCQRPNPRAKTWHKIWMTSLNPNYDTTSIPSRQNSQNKCQKSSFTYDHRRHFVNY